MGISKALSLIASLCISLLIPHLVEADQSAFPLITHTHAFLFTLLFPLSDTANCGVWNCRLLTLEKEPQKLIVELRALPGVSYRRGQTCAKGHAEPAVPDAAVFLRAPMAT
ncbi:hypothetical protein RJ641_028877 [Dillenia turbinata]|uniref:Uncharacterized protein n=1 Tax=Dillenia turbinata TaxID=194707 RepID=A0AAN8ZIN2_9MAGN